jgi:hypothetical protein
MKNKFKFLIVSAISLILVVAFSTYLFKQGKVDSVLAATYNVFHGQAWSDSIGFISFNCEEGGVSLSNICTTSKYAVKANPLGNLYGQAWNENLGWISFDAADVAGCPGGAGCAGKLTAGGLTGFARVKSMIGLIPDYAGGWDGFIDLSKVTRSVNDLTGTMQSDMVLFPASMNCVDGSLSGSVCAASTYKVWLNTVTIPDPTLAFTVTPSIMKIGQSAGLNWTAQNVDTCTASGDWTGTKSLTGNISSGALSTEKTYAYTLNCDNTVDGLNINATRNVIVTSQNFCGDGACNSSCGATLCGSATPVQETRGTGANSCPVDCTSDGAFTANPKFTKNGASSTLKWNLTGAQSCKLYNSDGVTVLVNIGNGAQTGTRVVPVTGKQSYEIRCDGNVVLSATVAPYQLFEF